MSYSQTTLINKFDWDVLIVLDACRYDYFEAEYKNYLSGTLISVESPGGDTPKWLSETFKGLLPITYFSANPYLSDIRWSNNSWKPSRHFLEIIEIYKKGWIDELNTVHPSIVNQAVKNYLRLFSRNSNKMIIHYLQPHFPAIGNTPLPIRHVEELYELDPTHIKKAYRDNLQLVLLYIKELINELHGKIVITADHGELLGEDGYYWHPSPDGEWRKELRIVPWLETFK